MTYPPENWRALGRYIQRRRLPIEGDMIEWAAKVGRSTRTLQGLERGEPQGLRTVTLVAEALGVDPEELFDILQSGTVTTPTPPVVQLSTAELLAMLADKIDRVGADVEQIKRTVEGQPAARSRVKDRNRPSP